MRPSAAGERGSATGVEAPLILAAGPRAARLREEERNAVEVGERRGGSGQRQRGDCEWKTLIKVPDVDAAEQQDEFTRVA
jgi:hypothetical protein